MALFNRLKGPVVLKEATSTRVHLEKLKEISKTIDPSEKKKIETEIKLLSIGLFGEDNIAFELSNSGIPMYVIRDLYIEHNDLTAQIDYLVVTRKMNFVIECKNLIGDIEIDREGNFIRTYKMFGKTVREGIYSPVTQNERHLEVIRQKRLEEKRNFLMKAMFSQFFDSNYRSVVVLANPKSVLKTRYAKKAIKDQVIRADQVNRYIKNHIEKSKDQPLNDKDMEKLAHSLLEMHQKKNYSYDKYATKEISKPKAKEPLKSNDELVEKLKDFRLRKSREEKIKPYLVFNNKQMEDLLEKMPKRENDLLKVSGFGKVKVDKYGTEIMEILKG